MKKVFITGGSTGIGLELSKIYHERGWRVGVCSRDLSKLSPEFREVYSCYELDVVDATALKDALFDFGAEGLDLVVANAGISISTRERVPSAEDSKRIIDTNVVGVLNTFLPAIEIMKKQGYGHLVGIGSVAGMIGLPGKPVYSMSKAAVNTMCEAMSVDLAPLNIQVTCIAPGFIETELTKGNKHPMPFLMSGEKGAQKIFRAIEKGKELYIFPWQMKWMILILQKMPRFLYRFLMRTFYRF